MDEFIRQAYADGMLNDDSHIAPDPTDYNLSTNSTTQPSTANQVSTSIDEPKELIYISDDDDDNETHPPEINIFPSLSSSHFSTPAPPPLPPTRPSVTKVSLPYTYLSLIPHEILSSNSNYQDFSINGCFASLVTNPRLIKNEFDLQAYVNDGSDCLLVRLASDLLAQRIGITPIELLNKRRECQNDMDKQKFQVDFNERLKRFGYGMSRLNTIMIIRFFSDNQIPIVIKIDEN